MTRCGLIIFVVCCFVPSILTQNSTEPSLTTLKNEGNTTEPVNDLIGLELQPFSRLAHGLSSGPITIIDNKTFFIRELYYDGKGPDAHFWVGIGPEPSNDGILVPSESGSNETLPEYNGQNVTIRLPGSLTVDQIDYLGVWCIEFRHNFGYTSLPRRGRSSPISKQEPLGVQLQPFSQLAHGLRSGPIVVVDKRTFFIPNLHYDGKGPDAHFWVGNGSAPSPTGVLVPDENGSKGNLQAYTGQNVYITLPDGLTVDKIEYLGMWCIEFKHNFGHVTIPKGIQVPEPKPDPRYTNDDKQIVRIQKCCPMNQVLLFSGCSEENQPFSPVLDFHFHNGTHIDDQPVAAQAIVFEPFVSSITCKHQQYPLIPGEDRFILLQNGSLVNLNAQQFLSQDNYCLETVDFGDETGHDWVTTAIICFSSGEVPLSNTVFVIYAVGVLISAIFLIITALVFLFIKEVRDARGKCVVAYSGSMAAAFICLAAAQFSGIDDKACTSLGFTIQFFLVCSFTWLTMITWETYYKIRKYNSDKYNRDRKRLWIYIALGILIPIMTLVISLVVDQMPGIPNTVLKPQFGKNSCWFDQKQGTMLYFYIPIGIAILLNIILAALMKWKLVWLQKHKGNDISWIAVRPELKPMFRSCTFLLSVMTLCWVMEIISYYVVASEGGVWTAIDIINSLQGLIVFVIFVMHRPVKDKICRPRRAQMDYSCTEGVPMTTNINGNSAANHNNHNGFLTQLKHAESMEDMT